MWEDREVPEEEITIGYSLDSFKLCLKKQTLQIKACLETQVYL
jgi:hypothetical protein